jgi:hypothetical protein
MIRRRILKVALYAPIDSLPGLASRRLSRIDPVFRHLSSETASDRSRNGPGERVFG